MMDGKTLIHMAMRVVVPNVARAIERDGALDPDNYMVVEDRGADVSVFFFSGLAALFAGVPAFEFSKLMKEEGREFNLVFFRDIRRLLYHVSPDGQPNGLEFFEKEILKQKEALGAKHNVMVGASGGASAAFYFATRCRFQQIVAFSPAFPIALYATWSNRLRTAFDVKKLLFSPLTYFELLLLTFGVLPWLQHNMNKAVGKENIWDVLGTYRDGPQPRPRATVFYGDTSWGDVRQVAQLADFPEVKTVPIVSGSHGASAELKKRGLLGQVIQTEIREASQTTDRRSAET